MEDDEKIIFSIYSARLMKKAALLRDRARDSRSSLVNRSLRHFPAALRYRTGRLYRMLFAICWSSLSVALSYRTALTGCASFTSSLMATDDQIAISTIAFMRTGKSLLLKGLAPDCPSE